MHTAVLHAALKALEVKSITGYPILYITVALFEGERERERARGDIHLRCVSVTKKIIS